MSKVISKGTYIDDLSNTNSTTIACIYHGDCGGIGISFFDPSIGSCKTYEITNDHYEITRLIEAENPCEILKYSFDGNNGDLVNKYYIQPKYQENILKYFYKNTGFLSAIEYTDLDTKHNARISLFVYSKK